VTSFNVSSRSDLRLYESDNNATMINLAAQGEGFLDTCRVLLQRMIETVPATVRLSEVISPMAVKPINATFDFDAQDNLIFSGYIRVSICSVLFALIEIRLLIRSSRRSRQPPQLRSHSPPRRNIMSLTSYRKSRLVAVSLEAQSSSLFQLRSPMPSHSTLFSFRAKVYRGRRFRPNPMLSWFHRSLPLPIQM
jgi:hypothetical protein